MQSTASVQIRSVGPTDVPALHALLIGAGLPVDGLADHLATTLVAWDGAEIVGSAGLEVYGGAALLRSVAVAERLRGTGLGRTLVGAAEERARQAGVERLYLLTETAADWFPRFGFQPIERSAVETAVCQSVEFTTACPAGARAMKKELFSADAGR